MREKKIHLPSEENFQCSAFAVPSAVAGMHYALAYALHYIWQVLQIHLASQQIQLASLTNMCGNLNK